MNAKKILLAILFADFVAFSGWSLWAGGLMGFVDAALYNPAAMQIAADLCIAVAIGCFWIWKDAKARGANPLPYLIAAPFVGSISLLAYLLLRPSEAPAPARKLAHQA